MSERNPYLWDIMWRVPPADRGSSAVTVTTLAALPEKDRHRIAGYHIEPYKKPCLIPELLTHQEQEKRLRGAIMK